MNGATAPVGEEHHDQNLVEGQWRALVIRNRSLVRLMMSASHTTSIHSVAL